MNKLLEQLETKQLKLKMSDYAFAAYLNISKQLWGQFKSGKIVYSRKIESAAWEKFHIYPEARQAVKSTGIMSVIKRIIGLIKK